jgi:hypothetical protein
MVDLETKFSEPPFGAPLPKSRHERHAVELVLDPTFHRLPIAPHRREPISPIRACPHGGVKTAFDRTDLGHRPLQMSPKLRIARFGEDELGNHQKGLGSFRDFGQLSFFVHR